MPPQVVGAGLGRTGTKSLKSALERLLGGTCYHMAEVAARPEDAEVWRRAYEGDLPDWATFLGDFSAVVDWPAAPFWEPMADAFGDAVILLSTRDADAWWASASGTILLAMDKAIDADPDGAWTRMAIRMTDAFTPDWRDEHAAKAAYLAHNDRVRATADPERLVEWHPGDGWEPLCAALGVAVPDEPFPHTNTSAEFRRNLGLDAP